MRLRNTALATERVERIAVLPDALRKLALAGIQPHRHHNPHDHVARLRRKEIPQGPAGDVLTSPKQDYTRALLDAAPGRNWDFANFRPVAEAVVA